MTKDEIFKLIEDNGLTLHGDIEHFADLVAQHEREAVANWLMRKGFATGHGDAIVDMLDELEWQVAEREREACAKACEEVIFKVKPIYCVVAENCVKVIRARGQE